MASTEKLKELREVFASMSLLAAYDKELLDFGYCLSLKAYSPHTGNRKPDINANEALVNESSSASNNSPEYCGEEGEIGEQRGLIVYDEFEDENIDKVGLVTFSIPTNSKNELNKMMNPIVSLSDAKRDGTISKTNKGRGKTSKDKE